VPEILWEDPPPISSKQLAHERNIEIFAQLKANPGKWAKVAEDTSIGSANTWLRWGCEVRRQRTTPGKCNIWVRWVEIE
jgi:hypothetical protein